MVISFAIWLENLGLFEFIRSSGFAYPILLALHLTFISTFGALILITDIRLLGWGLRSQPVSDIIDQLRVPKRIGFVLAATCGVLLAGSKAEEYYHNAFFRVKLLLFATIAIHALVFRPTVYNNASELDRVKQIPGRAKLAGAISILLWLGVVCAGRGIGYIAAPFGFHYVGVSAPAPDIAGIPDGTADSETTAVRKSGDAEKGR